MRAKNGWAAPRVLASIPCYRLRDKIRALGPVAQWTTNGPLREKLLTASREVTGLVPNAAKEDAEKYETEIANFSLQRLDEENTGYVISGAN